jgi:1-acyl-sn-glycerol-3-phosphate acyltransferase/acyl carrier protein
MKQSTLSLFDRLTYRLLRAISTILLLILRLRYRFVVTGDAEVRALIEKSPTGVLLLPNHGSLLDGPLLGLYLLKFGPGSPVIAEHWYREKTPVSTLNKMARAISMPSFSHGSNSLTEADTVKCFDTIIHRLDEKVNVMFFPSGRLRQTGREVIGGNSGLYKLLKKRRDFPVVLIRMAGLWGSAFSFAHTGQIPDLGKVVSNGIKMIFRNGIFFAPKRTVTIELEIIPTSELPMDNRIALNLYLEAWYNKPFAHLPGKAEPISSVPYDFWKQAIQANPPVKGQKNRVNQETAVSTMNEQDRAIVEKIAEIARRPVEQIKMTDELGTDLGLDSLDSAGLIAFLEERYQLTYIGTSTIILNNVEGVIAMANRAYEPLISSNLCIVNQEYLNPLWTTGQVSPRELHTDQSLQLNFLSVIQDKESRFFD